MELKLLIKKLKTLASKQSSPIGGGGVFKVNKGGSNQPRHCERTQESVAIVKLLNNEITTQTTSVRNDASCKCAFTLAQVFLPHSAGSCRIAFTLAEVLITLGIIGVVAALTMPALISNIQDMVRQKRVENIEQKFSKATDKMLSISGMNGYASTKEFVNELKNHMSIVKVCENDDLRSCWPSEKVIISDDGEEWEIAKTKTGRTLKMKNDDSHEWDKTMGIVTADGVGMIMSYNKKCDIDPNQTVVWDSSKSNSTGCVALVFDWNGGKMPNKFGATDVSRKVDVFALNANGLGSACVLEMPDGRCFGAAFKPKAMKLADCQNAVNNNKLGIEGCSYSYDYWAGAVEACGGTKNMPWPDDIDAIADLHYNNGIAYEDMGLPTPEFYLWMGDEYSSTEGYFAIYHDPSSFWSHGYQANGTRSSSSPYAICLVD